MRRALLILAAAALLAGCAESSAEVNTPDAWDSVQADPALIRGAEQALTDAPPPAEGWRIGVVLAEAPDDWAITALTDGGPVYLEDSWNCEKNDGMYESEQFALLIDPGDLITWSLEGDDHRLCIGELEVLRKAAARLEGSDA